VRKAVGQVAASSPGGGREISVSPKSKVRSPEIAAPKAPSPKPEEKLAAPEPDPTPKTEHRTPGIDLVAYQTDVKPIDDSIDAYDYDGASSRANLLKAKYPSLIATKLENIKLITTLRKRCFDRVNSGEAKVMMGDMSRSYAFAGQIKKVDDSGVTAAIKKRWSAFKKDEIARFYRKAADPQSAEDFIGIAAFLMEGNVDEKTLDSALEPLGKAAGLGADVSALSKYVETLKKSHAEYAAALARGKALETAKDARITKEKAEEKASVPSVPPVVQSYDNVYVAKAATGDPIPHPLSRKTYTATYKGKKINIPEGMVFVPAGPFLMGKNSDGEWSGFIERQVYLDAYFIDKYEVTNAQYMEFVKATGHRMPIYWKANGGKIPEGRENYPVTCVSWEDAKAYCDWCGKRLPTEAEWEKAACWDARRKKKREYPWGDELDCKKANCCYQLGCPCKGDGGVHRFWLQGYSKDPARKKANLGGATAPVGKFREDLSAAGCYDMAGNVAEWIGDWYRADYYKVGPNRNPTGPKEKEATGVAGAPKKCRGVRGGAFDFFPSFLTTVHRLGYDPAGTGPAFGFRCAADYPWNPPAGPTSAVEGTRVVAGKPAESGTTPPARQIQNRKSKIRNDFDDVYVTTAATGEKVPHPLSRKTYKVTFEGKSIDVPEGMIYVPAGKFLMGKGSAPPQGPQHEVYLDTYFIDKYEVTNAQYMEFVKATRHPMPEHWLQNGGKIPEGKENHPVAFVTWDDAKAYCDWCRKRLPTEAEWEKAAAWDAAAKTRRAYPWGNEYNPRMANHCYQLGCRCNCDTGVHGSWWRKWSKSDEGKKVLALGGHTLAVGEVSGDRSFFGCFDMGGNVGEWVNDWYKENYYGMSPMKNPPGKPAGVVCSGAAPGSTAVTFCAPLCAIRRRPQVATATLASVAQLTIRQANDPRQVGESERGSRATAMKVADAPKPSRIPTKNHRTPGTYHQSPTAAIPTPPLTK